MPTDQVMLHCPHCHGLTVHLKQRANHVLHLLLSVVTFGIWIPVWFLIAMSRPRPNCATCGYRRPSELENPRVIVGIVIVIIALALVLGCASPPPPTGTTESTFDVTVSFQEFPNQGGCFMSWSAAASDPLVSVDYRLYLINMWRPDLGEQLLAAGRFHGSQVEGFDVRGVGGWALRYEMGAGLWRTVGPETSSRDSLPSDRNGWCFVSTVP